MNLIKISIRKKLNAYNAKCLSKKKALESFLCTNTYTKAIYTPTHRLARIHKLICTTLLLKSEEIKYNQIKEMGISTSINLFLLFVRGHPLLTYDFNTNFTCLIILLTFFLTF